MARRNCSIAILALILLSLLLVAHPGAVLAAPSAAAAPVAISGTVTIQTTTVYPAGLIIAPGAVLQAPAGYSLTMTVNGVETGQKLATTAGVDTVFVPGTYVGRVIITVAVANPVDYAAMGPPGAPPVIVTYPFRQAIYIGPMGVENNKSVFAAVTRGGVNNSIAQRVSIASKGECFNAIFVTDRVCKIDKAIISLIGNGRSDFIGNGAAIVGTGLGTKLVVDGANISARGVARTGVIANNGANVVVKNSRIVTNNGVLPADYIGTIDTTQMRSVPWMLSLSGNVRATNLLGTNTKASYINSYVASEGWGVLSTDGCTDPQLTAINSTIAITGEDGYGSYGIGNATERFLGCTFDVATYATISRGSNLYYGDSTREAVAKLNTDLDLGLTAGELNNIWPRKSVVNSDRFGIMWHGGGTLDVSGGTVFNTNETTFLDKGQAIAITVDGSKGAKLNPKNGILVQLMDDDDPGPNMAAGGATTNDYHEPTGTPAKIAEHDVTVADDQDALATFANIKLTGNFYNSTRGDIAGMFGPPAQRDLVLTFKNSRLVGAVSASTAAHNISTITAADYRELGEVTNTPSAAINNGVIISLTNGSKWVVTRTCYLTSLTIDATSGIQAPGGRLKMTVDGAVTPIVPGSTYKGQVVLTVR